MADIQHIGQLKPDQKNARSHNPRNIGMIVDALHEVGAARSIVIDENYRILAGNGTIDAAAEAGIEKMLVVPVDGETIVAVQRTGLTEAQKTRLALYDNRASDTAEWDAGVLAELAEDGVKLDDLWAPYELGPLLGQTGENDPLAEWQGMPECENEDLQSWRSIKVHFRCQEDMAVFFHLVGQPMTEKPVSIWYPEQGREDFTKKQYVDES